MKLVKSLLLGSAAGIAAVAGAQAADLPSRKAAPVEYVRVCSAYGAGFFYLPGMDTCLRVGGRVRAEYTVGTRYGDLQDGYGMRARGRLNVDARTATAYGTLRTMFRYELNNNSGQYRESGRLNAGIQVPGSVHWPASDPAAPLLDLAFVQFGPITAGRAQSFFDFYANDYTFSTIRTADSRLNLLAYTATFGSGFSATVSLEDRTSGTGNRENGAFLRFGAGGQLTYEGQDMPDIVASLRVDQGWGSAQLSGALTQRKVSSFGFTAAPTGTTAPPALGAAVPGFTSSGDEWGFAIQGGVKLNLPMLAAGDVLFLQAAYADGALGYLGWGTGYGVGRTGGLSLGDIGFDPATGNSKTSTGWSLVAVLRHFWTPELRTEVFGSYSELTLGYVNAGGYAADAVVRPLDPKELMVGANLIWSPVSGLDIGVEVLYQRLELASRVGAAVNTGGVTVGGTAGRNNLVSVKSDDAWVGRLRIQRDF